MKKVFTYCALAVLVLTVVFSCKKEPGNTSSPPSPAPTVPGPAGKYLFTHTHIIRSPACWYSPNTRPDTTSVISRLNDSTISVLGYNLTGNKTSWSYSSGNITCTAGFSRNYDSVFVDIENIWGTDPPYGLAEYFAGKLIK